MHRVELKALTKGVLPLMRLALFLMHRVELKASFFAFPTGLITVPNAPCGVESSALPYTQPTQLFVPNAPCGVERKTNEGQKPRGG